MTLLGTGRVGRVGGVGGVGGSQKNIDKYFVTGLTINTILRC